MRHATLCGGDVRLEFFPDKGRACATVSADGDFHEVSAANCDPDNLAAVMHGVRYHIAGPGWLCTFSRERDMIELDLWRDGAAKKRCLIPLEEYEQAIGAAFGSRARAYAA